MKYSAVTLLLGIWLGAGIVLLMWHPWHHRGLGSINVVCPAGYSQSIDDQVVNGQDNFLLYCRRPKPAPLDPPLPHKEDGT